MQYMHMSTDDDATGVSQPPFGDERDTIIARAQEASIAWRAGPSTTDSAALVLEIPSAGRETRTVAIYPRDVNQYSRINFTNVCALKQYDAVWDRASGLIEAVLESDRGAAFRQIA